MESVSPVNHSAQAAQTSVLTSKRPLEVAAPHTSNGHVDSVELSSAARLYANIPDQPVRTDKIAQVKQQIQDGSYLDPEKYNAAIDRLAQDLDLLS